MYRALHPLCDALMAIGAATPPPGRAGPLWALIAVATLGTWTWLGRRQRRLTQALLAAQKDRDAARAAGGESERAAAQKLRTAQAALHELEREHAGQKKKNYLQAQALAAAHQARREAINDLGLAPPRRQAEPARGQLAAAAPLPRAAAGAQPTVAAEPSLSEPTAAAAQVASANESAPTAAQALAEAKDGKIDALNAALARAQEALARAAAQADQDRAQSQRLSKRIEDLRRVDLMKVARLGREHYEAISALALVRGEVALPRRRRPPNNRRGPGATGPQAAAPSRTIATRQSPSAAAPQPQEPA